MILDSDINPVLLSSFVGALGMFGNENMGKIEEIIIKGLDIQIIIVNKYELFLIAIMDKDFAKEDIHFEAEKALDVFFAIYHSEINSSDPNQDINVFLPFKKSLYRQIRDYSERIEKADQRTRKGDFGFFSEAIAKMRDS